MRRPSANPLASLDIRYIFSDGGEVPCCKRGQFSLACRQPQPDRYLPGASAQSGGKHVTVLVRERRPRGTITNAAPLVDVHGVESILQANPHFAIRIDHACQHVDDRLGCEPGGGDLDGVRGCDDLDRRGRLPRPLAHGPSGAWGDHDPAPATIWCCHVQVKMNRGVNLTRLVGASVVSPLQTLSFQGMMTVTRVVAQLRSGQKSAASRKSAGFSLPCRA